MSLTSPDRSTRLHTKAIPLLGIASPPFMCAPTHRHPRLSRFHRNAFTTSSFSPFPQSTSAPPQPMRRHSVHNVYYQWFMSCMLNAASPAPDQRRRPAGCYASFLPIRAPMSTRNERGVEDSLQMGKVAGQHSCSGSLQQWCQHKPLQPTPYYLFVALVPLTRFGCLRMHPRLCSVASSRSLSLELIRLLRVDLFGEAVTWGVWPIVGVEVWWFALASRACWTRLPAWVCCSHFPHQDS